MPHFGSLSKKKDKKWTAKTFVTCLCNGKMNETHLCSKSIQNVETVLRLQIGSRVRVHRNADKSKTIDQVTAQGTA